MIYPTEWRRVAERFASEPGVTVVVGQSDAGKSSFSTLLVNLAVKKKMKVGLLDLDLGQSLIGPPAAMGLALATEPIRPGVHLRPMANWFVGDDSPASSKAAVYEGVTKLLERSKKAGIEILVVNTSGYVKGAKAEKFKLGIVKLVKPDRVVVLERRYDLNRLALELKKIVSVCRLRVPSEIRTKSTAARRRYREEMWERYLKGGQMVEVPKRRFANMPEFTTRGLRGTVVGLYDSNNDLLGVGAVVRVYPDRAVVFTKVAPTKIEWLEFGKVRAARRLLA